MRMSFYVEPLPTIERAKPPRIGWSRQITIPRRRFHPLPWYCRAKAAINVAAPFLVVTQKTNLALLVSAILKKQTLCLSELARAYPTPEKRRVPAPKHDLLHRLKRLWRFTDNERVDALEVQMALVSQTIACLGFPHLLGLAIDWTMFDTTLPSGERIR